MPSPDKSSRKHAASRKAILDAASKLFITRGLGGTSMQDIANELDLTRTAVYYYFKNKESILKSLTENVTLSARRMTGKVASRRDIDPESALRGLVDQHARLILGRPMEFRVVERTEDNLPPKLRGDAEAARRDVLENFAEVIERGIAAGIFRALDARIAAFALIGMCNWCAWWFKSGGRKTDTEISAMLADIAVHALLREPWQGGTRRASVEERFQHLHEELKALEQLLSQRRR